MKFTLEIDLTSPSMQTNVDIAERLRNLAAILRSQGAGKPFAQTRDLLDLNSNVIGQWEVTEGVPFAEKTPAGRAIEEERNTRQEDDDGN